MLTEYMLTDEQRKQIADIDKQIFDLQIKKAVILASARSRIITETKEEFEAAQRFYCQQNWQRFAMFGEPVIKNDAIAKIILGEKGE